MKYLSYLIPAILCVPLLAYGQTLDEVFQEVPLEKIQAYCMRLGYVEKSDGLANCVRQEVESIRRNMIANRRPTAEQDFFNSLDKLQADAKRREAIREAERQEAWKAIQPKNTNCLRSGNGTYNCTTW